MIVRLALLVGFLAGLAGCVTVDATLDADGSARLVIVYRTAPDATEFLERRRLTSAHVSVDSVKIFEDQTTVVRATVDDVSKLGASKGFELVDVRREHTGADEQLLITFRNPNPVTGESDGRPLVTLSVTLPGPVRGANHDAAVLGSRVSWSVSKREFARQPSVALRVRYTAPPPG